jgi:hypothetical protein
MQIEKLERDEELEEERESERQQKREYEDSIAETACECCGQRFVERTKKLPDIGECWTGRLERFAEDGLCPRCFRDFEEAGDVRPWTVEEYRNYAEELLPSTLATADECNAMTLEMYGNWIRFSEFYDGFENPAHGRVELLKRHESIHDSLSGQLQGIGTLADKLFPDLRQTVNAAVLVMDEKERTFRAEVSKIDQLLVAEEKSNNKSCSVVALVLVGIVIGIFVLARHFIGC